MCSTPDSESKGMAVPTIRVLLIAALLFPVLIHCLSPEPRAQPRYPLTNEDVDQWMEELSNWGRWGPDDQLGALNLITPEKRVQAAALVQEGFTVSLSRDATKEKSIDNSSPYEHVMTMTGVEPDSKFAVDTLSVLFHGYAHTHLDALCHMFYRGKMYNGYSQEEVTAEGAGQLDVHKLKDGIFTRGVLFDIPRLKGVPYLEPGTPIFPEDLEAWEKKAGFKVSSGDVVFIRTGRWARRAAEGPWDVTKASSGLHASCAKWLKERDVAILGSEAASDVHPSLVEGITHPIHQLVLIAMGVHIFDSCDLGALSQAAAERERWEFLLTTAPIPVEGGTGSPMNPIAVF